MKNYKIKKDFKNTNKLKTIQKTFSMMIKIKKSY